MGEHAISFKNIAGFPSRRCNGGLQHAVDLIAQLAQSCGQSFGLHIHVIRHMTFHHNARSVQDRYPSRQTFVQGQPRQTARQVISAEGTNPRRLFLQGTADHFREDHSYGLHGLNLVVSIVSIAPVLQDQDANHSSAPQDRHAHERVIVLLTGFRTSSEIGVGASFRQGHGFS